jgi:hypothetical protein
MGKQVLLVSGEGKSKRQNKEEDLGHHGADHGGHEEGGVVAHHSRQPQGGERRLQREKRFPTCFLRFVCRLVQFQNFSHFLARLRVILFFFVLFPLGCVQILTVV